MVDLTGNVGIVSPEANFTALLLSARHPHELSLPFPNAPAWHHHATGSSRLLWGRFLHLTSIETLVGLPGDEPNKGKDEGEAKTQQAARWESIRFNCCWGCEWA